MEAINDLVPSPLDTMSPGEVEATAQWLYNHNQDHEDFYSAYNKLMTFYADEIPYSIAKARTGDPEDWLLNKMGDEELYHLDMALGLDRQEEEVDPNVGDDQLEFPWEKRKKEEKKVNELDYYADLDPDGFNPSGRPSKKVYSYQEFEKSLPDNVEIDSTRTSKSRGPISVAYHTGHQLTPIGIYYHGREFGEILN